MSGGREQEALALSIFTAITESTVTVIYRKDTDPQELCEHIAERLTNQGWGMK